MTAEVELYQPRATVAVTERDIVDGWVQVVGETAKLADYIAVTDFVPKNLRGKPAAIAACILTGREMGIGPMQSLKSIHMVQGTPTLSAEYKRARALERGHEIVYEETNNTRCIVRGRRKGTDEWVTVTWHIDDAKRAGLLGKDVWKQYPRRMLQARATSELCDLKFPDCSLGLATTEEAQDGGIVLDAPEVVPAIEAPAPAPRTAQRRQRTTTPPPAEKPSEPVAKREDPADGLPPLPGEDEPGPTTSAGSSSAGRNRQPQATSPSSPSSPGNSEPEPPLDFDPDEHGTATRGKGGQLTAVWSSLNQTFQFASDDAGKEGARMVVEHVIGRQLDGGTTGDLSYSEAKAVLDTLANYQKIARQQGREPREVLLDAMSAAEQAARQDEASDG